MTKYCTYELVKVGRYLIKEICMDRREMDQPQVTSSSQDISTQL